ncbi:MAG: RNA polymerase sigma factor [Chloroflexota bacterium]
MPTDEELARGVQQGDADDLRWLVERHHALLVGFLYRQTADRPLAQDLAQETFLRMMRAIQQYHYPRPFKPWLYAIAVNLLRDYYGQAEMRHTEAMPETLALSQTGSLAPERVLVRQDEWQRVQTAVSQLPPLQRAAILLRYHEGMSLLDIATALDIPVGTVKSRLSLALRALRQNLAEDG